MSEFVWSAFASRAAWLSTRTLCHEMSYTSLNSLAVVKAAKLKSWSFVGKWQ